MSTLLDSLIARAKADRKTIVLAEGDDPRTLEAAEQILAAKAANLIILGDVAAMAASGRTLEGATLIDPRTSELRQELADVLYEARKAKGMTPEQAFELAGDVLYFGVLLVKTGRADGMVQAPATLRATCCAPRCRSCARLPAWRS